MLGSKSSGGSKGSILGPSRLLEDGGVLFVWGAFFVLDACVVDFVVFADFGGFEAFVSSVRSSNSHPDLLVITTTPLFQITPVLNTGLSLSEPLQLYKGYNAI